MSSAKAGCGGTWSVSISTSRVRFTRCNGRFGLKLFLMIDDPSRVFLTTHHPNGGPFTARYPHFARFVFESIIARTALAENSRGRRASKFAVAGIGA